MGSRSDINIKGGKMKYPLKITFYFSFLFVALLVSCNSIDRNDPVTMDENNLNQQILLRAPEFGNTFKTRNSILLELKYNSTNEITLPNDFNLQIFEKTDTGWVELQEIPTIRIPTDDIVMSQTKYMPIVQAVYVHPDLADLNKEYTLRIYVFGQMKNGDIVETVAAYTDFRLNP